MNPVEAVQSVYRQYVGFNGRASRSEFWWFWLFYVGALIVLLVLPYGSSVGVAIVSLFVLGTFLPQLALHIRRLHDIGRTGWWMLLSFVPFGSLVLLVWYVFPSQQLPNKYGSPPGSAPDFATAQGQPG